jgi:hypothetical protein
MSVTALGRYVRQSRDQAMEERIMEQPSQNGVGIDVSYLGTRESWLHLAVSSCSLAATSAGLLAIGCIAFWHSMVLE